MFKPAPILDFFRNEFIRKAFRQAFYENNLSILDKEAEGIIEWNQETAQSSPKPRHPGVRSVFECFRGPFRPGSGKPPGSASSR